MPIFQSKVRTVESYLAGAGASGALLAGAFIAFVLLVGAATFDSWPHYGRLLPGGGDVTLDTSGPASQAPAAAPVHLGRLPGGKHPAAHGHGRRVAVHGDGGTRPGGAVGGNQITGGGTTPQSLGQNTIEPSGPSGSPSGNVVQQAVSNVGNTVQTDTATLGSNLGAATTPAVGDTVTRLGSTVNGTLQQLAGNP